MLHGSQYHDPTVASAILLALQIQGLAAIRHDGAVIASQTEKGGMHGPNNGPDNGFSRS